MPNRPGAMRGGCIRRLRAPKRVDRDENRGLGTRQAKYNKMLQNFFQLLPASATLGLLLPAHSFFPPVPPKSLGIYPTAEMLEDKREKKTIVENLTSFA